jgi:hypothetical protein
VLLRQIRAAYLRPDDEDSLSLKLLIPCFQEKPLSFSHAGPYRKRTHVGGMNILRRLRELRRRNSANWYRNFGIRYASGR